MFKKLMLNVALICLLPFLSACIPKNNSTDDTKNTQIITSCFATKLDIKLIDRIEPLKGGASGAQLFKVYANNKMYVVRMIKNCMPEQRQHEITCQEIASKQGYGPTVYATDADQGIIIMDFLERQILTDEVRCSDKYYGALGTFLRKMHTGTSFPPIEYDNYQDITQSLKELRSKAMSNATMTRIENIVQIIQAAAQKFLHVAPCHNDLNPTNLFYSGDKFLAIDFQTARQEDPFFDIASMSLLNCFDPAHEQMLLNVYFQRPMLEKEKAKFYLFKQLAYISIALQLIRYEETTTDLLAPNKIGHAQSLADVIASMLQGKICVEAGHSQERILLAQSIFKEVFAHAESQEFKNAVECLSR